MIFDLSLLFIAILSILEVGANFISPQLRLCGKNKATYVTDVRITHPLQTLLTNEIN
jgi:hypothetical protein